MLESPNRSNLLPTLGFIYPTEHTASRVLSPESSRELVVVPSPIHRRLLDNLVLPDRILAARALHAARWRAILDFPFPFSTRSFCSVAIFASLEIRRVATRRFGPGAGAAASSLVDSSDATGSFLAS